jgi:sterol desaturase/sphingolipid hydroxylase (fatty acid hydroxylase superfamily)
MNVGTEESTSTARFTKSGVAVGIATGMVFVGALVVRSQLAVGLVVLAAIFVPMERVFALNTQPIFRKGWRTDAVHFVVNNLLTTLLLIVAVVTAGTVLTAAVPGSLRAAVAHQPIPLQVGEAFLLAEVFGYWGHRAAHTVPWLWKFHRVHHSIREMDWLAAGRLHPVDQAFIRSCAVLPIVALGFARGALGAFVAFTTLQAIFVHANVRFRFGPLRWLVSTPEFHHWHHSADPAVYNRNFAGEFPWIDLLFGTLHLPSGTKPATYGIAEDPPNGYLSQLAWPFQPSGQS